MEQNPVTKLPKAFTNSSPYSAATDDANDLWTMTHMLTSSIVSDFKYLVAFFRISRIAHQLPVLAGLQNQSVFVVLLSIDSVYLSMKVLFPWF